MALVITLAVLAPLAAPGYVLSYDLVFVPRQPLRWEVLGPSGGLPRAVPQDAVVSLLSLLAPGWLLERVALAAVIYLAVIGAGRLVPARRPLTRVVAAVTYAWSAFLAERLLLGQWGLLLAYAALPWLVAAAIAVRSGRAGGLPRLAVAAGVSAITPTGGLIAFVATVALTVERGRQRAAWAAVGIAALVNAPWVLAAATTAAGARSDPAGVAAFAVRAENWSGPLGAVAGTGGRWNAQTMPASRASALVPVMTLLLFGFAVAGLAVLRRRWPAGAAGRLAVLAAGGVLVALAGATPLADDLLAWAVRSVSGAGLLRDGHKFLGPYALILAVTGALGVERAVGRLALPRARAVLVTMAVLPVVLLPDLAWGGAGRLRPVAYPADWDRVAGIVAAAPGGVLSLPFSEYRSYPWNRGRTVIDPAPRYLAADVVADDTLRVGEIEVRGEDPLAAQVRALLATGGPVASIGVRWVLVHRDTVGPLPATSLAGLVPRFVGENLELYENPAASSVRRVPLGRRWLLLGINLVAVGVLIASIWRLRRSRTAW